MKIERHERISKNKLTASFSSFLILSIRTIWSLQSSFIPDFIYKEIISNIINMLTMVRYFHVMYEQARVCWLGIHEYGGNKPCGHMLYLNWADVNFKNIITSPCMRLQFKRENNCFHKLRPLEFTLIKLPNTKKQYCTK